MEIHCTESLEGGVGTTATAIQRHDKKNRKSTSHWRLYGVGEPYNRRDEEVVLSCVAVARACVCVLACLAYLVACTTHRSHSDWMGGRDLMSLFMSSPINHNGLWWVPASNSRVYRK